MLVKGSGKFALLPTVGGQTALNLAVDDLADAGILERYNVELIGANQLDHHLVQFCKTDRKRIGLQKLS